MRWTRLALFASLAFSLLLGLIGTAASAATDEWQSRRMFIVFPQLTENGSVRLVYSLRDPQGQLIGEPTVRRPTEPRSVVEVPPVPGIYSFEERSEDAAGNTLGAVTTALRFDDAVPPAPVPRVPAGWILETEPVTLEFEPPAGPSPISGIRGYELTLDQGDVRFKTLDDSISLGFLPEGLNHVEMTTVSGSGVHSEIRTLTLAVDATAPSVSLQGLPAGWSNGPVKLTAFAHDSLSGMAASGPAGPLTAIAFDGGSPTTAPGATASTWVGGSGVHTVRFYGRDAAGNVADGGPGSPPPQTALVRIDEEPPRVEFAAAQDASDPERIEAVVSDPLSGPSPSRGSIAVRPAGTRANFAPLPTRVEAGRLVAHWDSDSYPPSKYEFLASGFDSAGNSASGTSRSHGGRMILVNPLKAPVTLHTKLAGFWISGSLRRSSGGAADEQTVAIIESFATGSDRHLRTTEVRTAADGSFSLRLKPGPSREVTANFGGTRLLSRASKSIHLAATTRIRFHVSAATAAIGGRPVVFSGRVAAPGAQGALAGLPVELQFRYPGADWSEFRTVEADTRGRFRFAYRFSDNDSRGIHFRFRAYVKGREAWPFGPGASRPVIVTGR
jgi:hypothetical protein